MTEMIEIPVSLLLMIASVSVAVAFSRYSLLGKLKRSQEKCRSLGHEVEFLSSELAKVYSSYNYLIYSLRRDAPVGDRLPEDIICVFPGYRSPWVLNECKDKEVIKLLWREYEKREGQQ